MNETESNDSRRLIRHMAEITEAKAKLMNHALQMEIILERFAPLPPELEFWQNVIDTIVTGSASGQAQ